MLAIVERRRVRHRVKALLREAEALEGEALSIRRSGLSHVMYETLAYMPGWDPGLPLEGTSPNDALKDPRRCGWAMRLLRGTPYEVTASDMEDRSEALRVEAQALAGTIGRKG